jgi:hypothetical protein
MSPVTGIAPFREPGKLSEEQHLVNGREPWVCYDAQSMHGRSKAAMKTQSTTDKQVFYLDSNPAMNNSSMAEQVFDGR